MKESVFQKQVIDKLRLMFPGCYILKNDANYIQGFPDLLILYNDRWAALECKRSEKASRRPNQLYYVNKLAGMSYASFIYPENEERVLDELCGALQP